jgi:hypothetical protein
MVGLNLCPEFMYTLYGWPNLLTSVHRSWQETTAFSYTREKQKE